MNIFKSYVITIGGVEYYSIEFIRFDDSGIIVKVPSKNLNEIKEAFGDGLYILSSGEEYNTLLFTGIRWGVCPNAMFYL